MARGGRILSTTSRRIRTHLNNLARKPAYKKVLNDMRRFHRQVWNGDDVEFRFRLGKTPT